MGASYGPSDEQDKRTELFVVISSCYCSYNYWPDFIEGTVSNLINFSRSRNFNGFKDFKEFYGFWGF